MKKLVKEKKEDGLTAGEIFFNWDSLPVASLSGQCYREMRRRREGN